MTIRDSWQTVPDGVIEKEEAARCEAINQLFSKEKPKPDDPFFKDDTGCITDPLYMMVCLCTGQNTGVFVLINKEVEKDKDNKAIIKFSVTEDGGFGFSLHTSDEWVSKVQGNSNSVTETFRSLSHEVSRLSRVEIIPSTGLSDAAVKCLGLTRTLYYVLDIDTASDQGKTDTFVFTSLT